MGPVSCCARLTDCGRCGGGGLRARREIERKPAPASIGGLWTPGRCPSLRLRVPAVQLIPAALPIVVLARCGGGVESNEKVARRLVCHPWRLWIPASPLGAGQAQPEKSVGSGFSREMKVERGRSKRLRRAASPLRATASRRVIGCGGIRPPFSARKLASGCGILAFPGIAPGV